MPSAAHSELHIKIDAKIEYILVCVEINQDVTLIDGSPVDNCGIQVTLAYNYAASITQLCGLCQIAASNCLSGIKKGIEAACLDAFMVCV